MYKLIRDNIPDLMQANGMICNYAIVQNQELFINLLKDKLVEEVNEFLYDTPNTVGCVEELADILLVVHTLADAQNWDLTEAYSKKLDLKGGFTKKLIGFFPDPEPVYSAEYVDQQ